MLSAIEFYVIIISGGSIYSLLYPEHGETEGNESSEAEKNVSPEVNQRLFEVHQKISVVVIHHGLCTGMKVNGSSWLSSHLTWSRPTTPYRP